MRLSIVSASLLLLALTLAACVGQTSDTGAEESSAKREAHCGDPNALDAGPAPIDAANPKGGARAFVGTYSTPLPAVASYVRLELHGDGTYTAKKDISLQAVCMSSPCVTTETGTWTTEQAGGVTHLIMAPQSTAATNYVAQLTLRLLTLTSGARTQKLARIEDGECYVGALDCKDGAACGPLQCTALTCADDDPTCCDPGHCASSADAGSGGGTTPCGSSACSNGEICCDALHGTCAAPGSLCTQ